MKLLYNKNEVYSSVFTLTQYNDNYFKITLNKYQRKKGFEEIKKPLNQFSSQEECERISLSRTKRNIKEIALCNNFTYFATLTVASNIGDRYNLIECQNKLIKILKFIKRKHKDFKYLFITEKHKDGAFHFHGFITDIPFYKNSNNYLSSKYFDKLGFNSFSKIKNYNKCCNYILKYITKDCIKNDHNRIYISSRGLKKAEKYQIPPIDIKWSFENDFVKIKEFSSDELSKSEIFQLVGLYVPDKRKKFLKNKRDFFVLCSIFIL